jgi:ribosomal protein L37AE/L43A
MNKESELKCPFCKKKSLKFTQFGTETNYFFCKICHFSSPPKTTKEEAITVFNKLNDMNLELLQLLIEVSNDGYLKHGNPLLVERIKNLLANNKPEQLEWFCERCKQSVSGTKVTFSEHHESCGGRCR